jgi:regulatory protein
MIRLGFVDDASFAAMVIRDALRRGSTGPHGIRKKLAEKGVNKELIQQLTDEYFVGELQKEIAVTLLRKRIARTERSLKKLLPAQRKARLYQYLAQRGFDSDVVSYALKQIEV